MDFLKIERIDNNMRKKNTNYFAAFINMIDYSCQAGEMLHNVLNNFSRGTLEEKLTQMHEIENSADKCRHDMMNSLVKEFITPIEREDIITLGHEIDEITDNIEDVLQNTYMYNVSTILSGAIEFVDIIVASCKALKNALEKFQSFRKSTTIKESLIEINRLEEDGDKLYTESMYRLYSISKDPIEIIAWTKIFERLEKCCDSCERVANTMESIIMKNS